MEKNNKRLINAWASYDWSNSVYNLIITTAIFPIYYSATTKEAFGGEIIDFFGISIKNSVLYTYAISFSFLVIVFLSPILSGIADYAGVKKKFMKGFTYLGALACIGLFFFTGENVEYGIAFSVVASIGFAGSLVFYNAFLPEIATADRMDNVSAKGFAMGYIGSVILLVINLVIILNPEMFGFSDGTNATRFGFLLVGIWWLSFSQIAFYHLKDYPTGNKIDSGILTKGVKELKKVFVSLRKQLITKRFLASFFIYSMGVNTVMLLAPIFAESEIGFEADQMILLVIILQLLAVVGAYFFAFLSRIKGNKFAIGIILIIWAVICIFSYLLHKQISFYIMGGIIGVVMGAIQSLSRSTYSKLIPTETIDTASYFSFYDISEKLAIVVGTFAYGYIEQVTGNMRYSMISMALFFIIGFVILQTVPFSDTKKELA
jgi:UMF1 family MFS transporter